MDGSRWFHLDEHFQPADGEPVLTVVTRSPDAVVVAWHVKPGQSIAAHIHPAGQDTWTILSGAGRYITDAAGATRPIGVGDVVVARCGEVHGVHNIGAEPLRFVSVVSPAEAGYEPL